MSKKFIIVSIIIFIILVITSFRVNNCASGCGMGGHEGVFFFSKPLILTEIGKYNIGSTRQPCPAVCLGKSRIDIGLVVTYILLFLIMTKVNKKNQKPNHEIQR